MSSVILDVFSRIPIPAASPPITQLPSTGYLKLFDIVKYYDGLLLRIPSRENPSMLEEVVKQEKMLDVFKEYLNWSYIMGLNNAGDFNLACEEGHATDLINVAEALQEKR